jgi:hypothetical protein
MKERQKSFIGKISGEILMSQASIEVRDPNNNLEDIRKHLQTESAIFLFNHFKGDFFLWARFIKENISSLDNVTALVAMKYMDPNRSPASKALNFMFPLWEKSHGVKVLPIVQSYDRHNYEDPNVINTTSMKKAIRTLREPGKIIAISPEGTRSKDGGLSEAEDGIELLLKISKSMAIPLAAEHSNDSSSKLVKSNTIIHVGKPFFAQDIEVDQSQNPESKKKDLIMQRIAILLPEQNRGFYK